MNNINKHIEKTTLNFLTCGSVDNGKSSLIGRLLFETNQISEDHFEDLKIDSKKFGTQDQNVDFALLLDGLSSEREQGITIDVAYRYFSTKKRKFIVADTPGHVQYTRNMASGASNSSVAIIILDATKGILNQTKRHSFIVSLLGIRKIILAVNKLDLLNYDQSKFNEISDRFNKLVKEFNFSDIQCIPISALNGDNIVKSSTNMDWYQGPTILTYLENVKINEENDQSLRLPIQYVLRTTSDFRGYCGHIASGEVYSGKKIKILPSGTFTTIKEIVDYNSTSNKKIKNDSITFTVTDNVDISRGDMVVDDNSDCEISNQFRTKIIWMDEKNLVDGRNYYFKFESKILNGTLYPINKIDFNTFEKVMPKNITVNDIIISDLLLAKKIPFDTYLKNKTTGSFIIIDPLSNTTCGAGMIDFALRRTSNLTWLKTEIDKKNRSKIKNQKPCVIWFTGLSGSGKSTIANILEKKLYQLSCHTMLLDGDNVRFGLNKDLGFTEIDRIENIRRISEVSKLMTEAGLITIVSFISPFESEREMAKNLFEQNEFFEIYVKAPLSVVEKRDPKGLYKKARSGKLPNFTGIDSPYEAPKQPNLTLQTSKFSADECVEQILEFLYKQKILSI